MKAHKNEGSNMKPATETRLALLEQSNTHFTDTLKRIDNNLILINKNLMDAIQDFKIEMNSKFDLVEKRFDLVEKRFEKIENKIDINFEHLTKKIDGNFRFLVTTIITLFVASGVLPVISAILEKFIH